MLQHMVIHAGELNHLHFQAQAVGPDEDLLDGAGDIHVTKLIDVVNQQAVEDAADIAVARAVATFVDVDHFHDPLGKAIQLFAGEEAGTGSRAFIVLRDHFLIVRRHLEEAPPVDNNLIQMEGKTKGAAINLSLILAVVMVNKVVRHPQLLDIRVTGHSLQIDALE